jgi:hypothetical protein
VIGFENRILVLTRWAFGFIGHGRGARLITGQPDRSITAGGRPVSLTPASAPHRGLRHREAA